MGLFCLATQNSKRVWGLRRSRSTTILRKAAILSAQESWSATTKLQRLSYLRRIQMKKFLCWAALALCACGLAAQVQAQMVVQSLTGPVTQTEIDSFRTFMQGQTVPPDNTGDAYGHHTGSQRFDALGLMYIVSHDQGILDIYVHWVDVALHARNNPTTGCIAWTGRRELFWPTSVNADGTCGASTNGEQGWVISHQAWVAEEILR